MIIDTRGIEITLPAEWISKEGIYTLKITEIKPDGFSSDGSGAEKFKIIFKSSTGEMQIETFINQPNMLWKIKVIEKAIKAPEIYDINDFVGRYVVATIKSRTYNNKMYYDIKEYAECALNNKLPPIKEASIQNTNESYAIVEEDEDVELLF